MDGCAEFVGEARGFEEGYCVPALAQEDCCRQAADTGAAYCYLEWLILRRMAVDAVCVAVGAVCEVHGGEDEKRWRNACEFQ
jgi:hypothetical protein